MEKLGAPMKRLGMLFLFTILASFLFYPPVFADTLDDMRRQIDTLQDQVQQLEKSKTNAADQAKTPKKGSVMLSGINTELTIGGYAKLDVVYRTFRTQ